MCLAAIFARMCVRGIGGRRLRRSRRLSPVTSRRRSKIWRRLSEDEFREMFRTSPIQRAKYAGFLRNVAIAMGNSKLEKFREPLEKLAQFPNEMVREHALWALAQLAKSRSGEAAPLTYHK